jgi:hypothetical protein
MLPKYHIFFGILFTLSLYAFFPQISFLNLAIVLFSSILIDGDHYLYYIFKKKNFNPLTALKWHKKEMEITCPLPMNERKKRYTGFYFFHGIEWIIVLAILGRFIFPPLIYVSIGFLFHFALDIPDEFRSKGTIHKSSLIYMTYLLYKENRKGKK